MSIKIALVSNSSWSFYKFRKGIIKNLIDLGYEVILMSPKDEFINELLHLGTKFFELKKMSAKGINPINDIQCYLELKSIYNNIKPDIIFHYTIKPNIYGTYAAYKNKIKNIAVITGLGYTFLNKGIVSKVAIILYKFALNKANKIWFLNVDDKNIFIEKKIASIEKLHIIKGEGIDCNYFMPRKYKETNSIKEVEFLFIGRLLLDKGIKEYYESAKLLREKYPTVKCSILGFLNSNNPQAIDSKEFQKWIDSGIINYYGSVNDVRTYLENCSCVVLPSYREGLSTVLLEAASMCKPLIASNIAGCKEVVDNKLTGFLVEPYSSKDLVDKMEKFFLLTDLEKKIMGEKGREKIQKEFSIENIYEEYKKAIKE